MRFTILLSLALTFTLFSIVHIPCQAQSGRMARSAYKAGKWLFGAGASGIVGGYTYDGLKNVLNSNNGTVITATIVNRQSYVQRLEYTFDGYNWYYVDLRPNHYTTLRSNSSGQIGFRGSTGYLIIQKTGSYNI